MGLIIEAQTDLKDAFDNDLSDIIKTFDLVVSDDMGQYNPVSGEAPKRKPKYPGRGLFEEYETKEINDNIKVGDLKLIIISNEIGQQPKIDNVIIDQDYKEYLVIKSKSVFDIVYEVQVREH